MNNIPQIFVGIDIAKDFLDIHLHPLNKAFRITNNKQGIRKLLKMFSKYEVQQVVFESSGGYGHFLYKELLAKDYTVWRVEPKRIKAFIVSEGVNAKTDQIDAKMIALFASQKKLKYRKVELRDNEVQIRVLVKRRNDLSEMITKETNRVKHPAQISSKKRINKHILFMKDDVKHIDQDIEQLINNDEALKLKAAIIKSIPGFGSVSVATLIALLPELGLVDYKKISALVGVAPFIQQSGASKGIAFIKGGRSALRKALHMPTLVAIRYNPVIKAFYDRLRKNGKNHKVALTAAMHKLVIIVNAMMKSGELWHYN